MAIRNCQNHPRLAVVTAAGRGAIGVIVVWGPKAVEFVDSVFRPVKGSSLTASPPGRLRLGHIGQGLGDEVVVVRLPFSTPCVEIHCHAGSAALTMVIRTLVDAGVEFADAAEWIRRQSGSRCRAEALIDLASAQTLRTSAILLDQAYGALDDELIDLITKLRLETASCDALSDRIERLLDRGRFGIRLTTGWRVVIAGKPNVGKSRLLNALAGYQRAIVDPTPGTTRDVVTLFAAFDGWPVELSDTAGVRTTNDELERSGIERARHQVSGADLVLHVLDRSEPLTDEDLELTTGPPLVPRILVANKADLAAAWGLDILSRCGLPLVVISAEAGTGIDTLLSMVVGMLVPIAPGQGQAVPFRREHASHLQEAVNALRRFDRGKAIAEIEAVLGSTEFLSDPSPTSPHG